MQFTPDGCAWVLGSRLPGTLSEEHTSDRPQPHSICPCKAGQVLLTSKMLLHPHNHPAKCPHTFAPVEAGAAAGCVLERHSVSAEHRGCSHGRWDPGEPAACTGSVGCSVHACPAQLHPSPCAAVGDPAGASGPRRRNPEGQVLCLGVQNVHTAAV
jgi:hypothetical protein